MLVAVAVFTVAWPVLVLVVMMVMVVATAQHEAGCDENG